MERFRKLKTRWRRGAATLLSLWVLFVYVIPGSIPCTCHQHGHAAHETGVTCPLHSAKEGKQAISACRQHHDIGVSVPLLILPEASGAPVSLKTEVAWPLLSPQSAALLLEPPPPEAFL